MRRIALGLACLVAAGGYVVGCGGTGGAAKSGNPGSGGSGTAAAGGTTSGGGNGGSAASGNGGSAASGNGGSAASGNGGSAASGNGGSGNPDASTGGSGASGSLDAGAIPDVVFSYDGPSDDGGQEACADLHVTAQPEPLDMYVMLDQSGSMGADCNVGQKVNSKWCHAINALSGFFHDPSASNDRVALQYFALSNGTCAGGAYDTPELGLSLLTTSFISSLDSSLNAHAPSTLTPTYAALNGVSKYTSTHQATGRVMVGILITDGYPEGSCDNNISDIAKIPQNLFNNYGIRTFIIGMTGATFSSLEQWAVAGGAPAHSNYCDTGVSSCHYYDVADGDPTAFINALKQIQQSALGCTYNMPKTDAGLIDPSKLSVQFTPSGGSQVTLSNAGSKTGCGANNGFYYDNNTSPTKINLCPTTCTSAGKGGSVSITVPCQGS